MTNRVTEMMQAETELFDAGFSQEPTPITTDKMSRRGAVWSLLVSGLLAAFCAIPSGCDKKTETTEDSASTPAAKTIKIGAISPFTGDGARYGEAARTGIDLAVDEINAAGGINGRKLVVQYEDDTGNQADAVSAFNKLVSVDKVPAILGPFYSGNVLACAPIANRTETVLLTGSATSDNIRDAGEYVFRVCPSNDEQARTIAQYARKRLDIQTAFIIYRNVDYGVTLRDAFRASFEELGGRILGAEAVPPNSSDVRPQLTKVRAANPEMVFAAVHYPEGGALLRQATELGIDSIVFGTDGGHDPQLVEIAGDAAEGSYWVTIGWGDENNPPLKRFREAYRKRYRRDPGVYSGLYYDATHVLAEAISDATSDAGAAIRFELLRIEYEGVTGVTMFDDSGDVSKPFTVYRIVDGSFQSVGK